MCNCSGLHNFWWESFCHSIYFSPLGKVLFISNYIKIFFPFIFSFQRFDSDVFLCALLWIFFSSWVHLASGIYRFMFLAKFGKFSAIIYFTVFLAPASFPSPSHIHMTSFLDFLVIVSHVPKALFFFSFTLFFVTVQIVWLLLLYLPVCSRLLLFTPFCYDHKCFCYCIFSVLKFSFDSSLYLLFLFCSSSEYFCFFADNFYFFLCFKQVYNCVTKHFYNGYLKYLLNYNISVILFWYLFFIVWDLILYITKILY